MKPYGQKRDYPKIDLFFNGDYYKTTTWSKTCKQAVSECIDSIESRSHSIGGIGLVETRILKNKHLLKGRFQK